MDLIGNYPFSDKPGGIFAIIDLALGGGGGQ